MAKLGEGDISALKWMIATNREGIGLFYPTVRRHGPLEELSGLIDAGLTILRRDGAPKEKGYWITPAGRQALEKGR